MARKYQLHGAFPSKAGDSAYQIAQKNGFEGTEQEWLASLVGPQGPNGGADDLLFDKTTGMLYLKYQNQLIGKGVQLEPTGSSNNNAVLTLENTTGWEYKTITQDSLCTISFKWSSIEDGLSTGPGTVIVKVGGVLRYSDMITQGDRLHNISDYLGLGYNIVNVTVFDIYNNSQTITLAVNMYDPAALKSTKLVERTLTGDYTNDRVTKVGEYAFPGLTFNRLSLPNVRTADFCGLSYLTATEIELASLSETTYWMFRDSKIDVVKVPAVTTIYDQSLWAKYINRMVLNRDIEIVGNALTNKNNVVVFDFHQVTSLPYIPAGSTSTVIIRTPTVCALQNAPGTTTVNVYVPASLVDSYKAATNWSEMADRIFAIEDYPDICEVN